MAQTFSPVSGNPASSRKSGRVLGHEAHKLSLLGRHDHAYVQILKARCAQANRDALETDLSGRLQEACDSATQWKEAAERVAAEKAEAEAAHAEAAAALAALEDSSSSQLVRC